ncbi:MAG TPA: hypothetical protein VEW48_09990 [Thermoanaerobaculia bacterium]|nr:hypothetical protein [Thermoanaerobaculia bacterium]
MRALIYVPIVHSEVDLGSMGGEVRRRFQEAFGNEEWERKYASVEAMWAGLRTKLFALPLEWRRTRLYQDGLPVCGRETEIVRDLAAGGSRNYQLLAELMERGATLMGTEDPELMVAEYRRIQSLVRTAQQREPDAAAEELKREGEEILRGRDAFIARRIETTLEEGETGILFLGLLHRVDALLDGKFDVRQLIHSLPFGADPWRRLKERGDERTEKD